MNTFFSLAALPAERISTNAIKHAIEDYKRSPDDGKIADAIKVEAELARALKATLPPEQRLRSYTPQELLAVTEQPGTRASLLRINLHSLREWLATVR